MKIGLQHLFHEGILAEGNSDVALKTPFLNISGSYLSTLMLFVVVLIVHIP